MEDHAERIWNRGTASHERIWAARTFAHVQPRQRRELFVEATKLINSHKIATLAATLSNEEYKANIHEKIREGFSVYGMCFNLIAAMNHKLAARQSYQKRIPFILDAGNPHKDHIVKAHSLMVLWQKRTSFLHVGGLHFEDDKDWGILQAADVVAWGVRRRVTGKSFGYGFEPIVDILEKNKSHGEANWKTDWMQEMGEAVMKLYWEARNAAESGAPI
jgi:hypothetical protein